MKMRKTTRRTIICVVYSVVFLLNLFMLNRFRFSSIIKIDGMGFNKTVIWIAILIAVLLCFIQKADRGTFTLLCSFTILALANSVIQRNINGQSLFAIAALIIPMYLFTIPRRSFNWEFWTIIRVLNAVATLYSIFAIASAFFNSSLMRYIGVYVRDSEGLSRAPLPLGSSITVSYYSNINLPFALLLFEKAEKPRKRILYCVSIIINIATSLVLLSRSSMYTSLITVILFFIFIRDRKKAHFGRKLSLLILLAAGTVFLFDRIDLSRLRISVFNNVSGFDSSRYDAINLGLYIWGKNLLFGSSAGQYFTRVWAGSNILIVDGIAGLVDPHNAWILLLSEFGVFGLVFLIFIWARIVKPIWKCKTTEIKRTMILFLIENAFLMLVGSQIVNEASFSFIVYTYCLAYLQDESIWG